MADAQHIEWLLEGVDAWNSRREHDLFEPDLSGVNLYGIFAEAGKLDELEHSPLRGINLLFAELTNTILARADLSGARLALAPWLWSDFL